MFLFNASYAELEPNNFFSTANIVTLNLPVTASLDSVNDNSDIFRVDLTQEGLLHAEITKDATIKLHAYLFHLADTNTAALELLVELDSVNGSFQYPAGLGSYFIQFSSYGGTGNYALNLTLDLPFYSADTEPNDSINQATVISGGSTTGTLGYFKSYQNADTSDWFSFTNQTADTVEIQVSKSTAFALKSDLFSVDSSTYLANGYGDSSSSYFQYTSAVTAGTYKVRMSLPQSNFGSYNIVIHFTYPEPPANGINSTPLSGFKIYPNPCTQVLLFNDDLNADYLLFNLAGQLIMSGKLNATHRIDVSAIQCGNYVLQLKTDKDILIQPFHKQ